MSLEILRRARIAECEFPESMHPVLRQVFAQRRIRSPDELVYGANALCAPDSLAGAADAAHEVDTLVGAQILDRLFLDGDRGQGAVLYHRYDGHYGLISPADG